MHNVYFADYMEVVYVLGASQAFFLSFLVFKKAGKSDGDYILAIWLAFMGLHLLDYYFFVTGFNLRHPHLLGVGQCFPMLEGPFMFVYILTMINKGSKFRMRYLWHGLPFLLFTIYFAFDFYHLNAADKLAYFKLLVEKGSVAVYLSEVINSALGPVYVIWSLIVLRRHSRNIENNFSYTEEIDLQWLRYVLIGLGFVWAVVIAANFLNVFPNQEMGSHMIFLAVTVAVFFLGYFGMKQQAIYLPAPTVKPNESKVEKEIPAPVIKEENRYKHSGLKTKDAEAYLERLLQYMKDERPYLNGKLSLKDVAAYLDISVNHLSQVINEQLGKSFFDFVNEYRVAEVKRQLAEAKHEQFTLLAVAYDSGFNSKSSFNNIFKKMTGQTPSEYVSKMAS